MKKIASIAALMLVSSLAIAATPAPDSSPVSSNAFAALNGDCAATLRATAAQMKDNGAAVSAVASFSYAGVQAPWNFSSVLKGESGRIMSNTLTTNDTTAHLDTLIAETDVKGRYRVSLFLRSLSDLPARQVKVADSFVVLPQQARDELCQSLFLEKGQQVTLFKGAPGAASHENSLTEFTIKLN